MKTTKYLLNEKDMPRNWYNIMADMPNPPEAVLHPGTKKPVTPEDLSPIFPMSLIEQEVSTQRFIPIPDEVMDVYSLWRPSPLYRAHQLEKALKTHSKIYYKYEGVSPAGSHKPNTAIPQAYYNKKEGFTKLTTETGAGQWGSALSFAGNYFGLHVKVYMVKISYEQKPYRRAMIETWGGEVYPSPTDKTESGRAVLAKDPNSIGSLGIAISEAVEEAAQNKDTNYSLGSVLNHVLLHQTIIGEEAILQMKMAGDDPDIIIGCHGGGSNFAGLSFPFLREKFAGKNYRIIAVEPKACPTLTRGKYEYDFGDVAGLTPLIKMYTLGHDFMPPGIHAGGLRYHGASQLTSQMLKEGYIEAQSYEQREVFQSALLFARSEGILPAPESNHAIHAAIVEARKADQEGKSKTILFNLSGHGHVDMAAYTSFLSGKMADSALPESVLEEGFASIPKI